MSVIIVFPDGTDWFKANWVFRQLAQDVSDHYSSDAEVCKAVERRLHDTIALSPTDALSCNVIDRLHIYALCLSAQGEISAKVPLDI